MIYNQINKKGLIFRQIWQIFTSQSLPKHNRTGGNYQISSRSMVPEIGLEPIRMLLLRILSPVRLPIPPLGHVFLLSFQFFC